MSGTLPLDQVTAALRECWSLRTSGKWLADNPARGQCNVTVLLVEEFFGGQILETPLPEGEHFYNRIDDQRVDLTDSQFDAPIAYADILSGRQEATAGTTAKKYAALNAGFEEMHFRSGSSGS